eukprot:scaffold4475_cov114-Isochrysis_galbana.AAC.9
MRNVWAAIAAAAPAHAGGPFPVPVQLARHAGAIVPAVEIHVVAKGDRRGEGGRGGGPGRLNRRKGDQP